MNLDTAKTIVANWDKPVIRQAFWYLLIPAMVEIQHAEPEKFSYFNAQRQSLRLLFLIKFATALVALFGWSQLPLPTMVLVGGQVILAYTCVMYFVWALAYWSMKIPASAQ
jgi:fatty acid desaturase